MSLSSDNDILMPTSGCATCKFFHTTPTCRSSSETWPRFVLWQWFSLRVLLISSNNKTNLTILTNVKYICQGFPLEKSEIENFNIAVIVHLTVHQGVYVKVIQLLHQLLIIDVILWNELCIIELCLLYGNSHF